MTRHTHPLFIASIIWKAHAAWEWLVQIQIPEANIRADLLLIWPVLAVVSGWAVPCVSMGMGAHPRFSGGRRLTGRQIKPTSAVKAFSFSTLAAYPPPC